MLYEMTSQDVKSEFHPFQDVFESSSIEEISVNEILERWFLGFRGKPFVEKPFFAIPNLSPISQIDYSSSIYRSIPNLSLILQIDYSSSIYRPIEFKNETTLTEEFFRKAEMIRILDKVSRILDKLTTGEEFLRDIDKKKLLNAISEILNEIPPEQMKISGEELVKRIRGVLVLESVSGILNELTPEQIKGFDDVVRRRHLFK